MHQMRRGQMSHQSSRNAVRSLRATVGSVLIATAALVASPASADVTECLKSYQLGRKDEAIRLCRRAAWQDNDLFAQAKLGDIYVAKSQSDKNYEDKVEAAVWYYHALINLRQAEHYYLDPGPKQTIERTVREAREGFENIYKGLLQDERMDVRNRVIYVQSCRGSEGFLLLGQLHDPRFERHTIFVGSGQSYGSTVEYITTPLRRGGGTPTPNYGSGYSGGSSAPSTIYSLSENKPFEKSEIEAQLYYRLADPDVFPIVKDYLNDPAIPVAGQNGTEPRSKADRWLSPFEYYASETRQRGELRSGTVLSDECPSNMAKERALALGKQMIPDHFIRDMLALLKFRTDGRSDLSRAIAKFQDMLGEPQTGELTPAQRVRLIQILAVQGHARAQRCLGIMYMKGIGVLKNLVRAEKWLRAADEQGDGEAAYALSELYTTGGPGIEKNEDMATRYRQRSAADGYTPVRDEFLRLFRAIP
jgi:TPR repeat protein